jgi:hypothetical protein
MTDTPSMRERMLAGELYIADDPELVLLRLRVSNLCRGTLPPELGCGVAGRGDRDDR